MRVRNSENPLDISAVHPESYAIVYKMAADLGCSVEQLIKDKSLQYKIKLSYYVTDKVGMPTLMDIKAELAKPGRDPREQFDAFSFAEGVNEIKTSIRDEAAGHCKPTLSAFGELWYGSIKTAVHIASLRQFITDPTKL